jgi:Zn-dependent protease/CBS domain-containing protein
MFGTRWQMFRLFGIPFYLDASWLVILALFTWTLSNWFGQELPGFSSTHYVMLGFVAAITFFVCILLHEMGHAVVARSSGMPVRGITLFLFGGVAELGGEPPSAKSEFFMAIAGPLVSAMLAALFWIGTILTTPAPSAISSTSVVLQYLAEINLTVLLFNMVPAFPLDGGRVLRSILWGVTGNLRKSTYWAALLGQGFAWLLILGGVVQFFLGNFIGGMWLGLIGLFLRNAAQGGYQQVLMRQALQGEPVRHFMNPNPIVVDPHLDLQHWVDDYVYRHHRKCFPVSSDGHLEGFITTRELARFPREDWSRHTVGELMQTDFPAISIPAETEALDALRKMQQTGSSRLLVTEGNRLVGIISLKDLLHFLQFKLGLGQQVEE